MSESKPANQSERMPWHRLFGLMLMDFFTNTAYEVQIEQDLSTQQQRIDVIILKKAEGETTLSLPDGMEDLSKYNLISFKSYNDTLDGWAMQELTGHYVAYRKWASIKASKQNLFDEEEFRLYAMSARYPIGLFQRIEPKKIQDGVYDCVGLGQRIRVVVLNELAQQPRNAMLHLFTAESDLVRYGRDNYTQKSANTSTLLQRLWQEYGQEGIKMPYTMEDFKREVKESVLKELTLEERLRGLAPEERLKGLAPEERFSGMSEEEIEAYLQRLRQQKKASGDEQSELNR